MQSAPRMARDRRGADSTDQCEFKDLLDARQGA